VLQEVKSNVFCKCFWIFDLKYLNLGHWLEGNDLSFSEKFLKKFVKGTLG
jgi:hypothetical protein